MNLALPLVGQLELQLGFYPGPGNLHMPWVNPEKGGGEATQNRISVGDDEKF